MVGVLKIVFVVVSLAVIVTMALILWSSDLDSGIDKHYVRKFLLSNSGGKPGRNVRKLKIFGYYRCYLCDPAKTRDVIIHRSLDDNTYDHLRLIQGVVYKVEPEMDKAY